MTDKNKKENQKVHIQQSYIYYPKPEKTPPKKTSQKLIQMISDVDNDDSDKMNISTNANISRGNKVIYKNNRAKLKRRRKRKYIFTIMFIAIILTAIVSIGLNIIRKTLENKAEANTTYDINAKDGIISSRTQEELQDIMSKIVDYDEFYLSINQTPVFENGQSQGSLWIENIPANHFYIKVTIVIDKTGEEVLKTDMIKPNQYIENAKLDTDLEKGTYLATAKFTIINPETLQDTGSAEVKITITVQN